MFHLVYNLNDIGSFGDLRSAWAVLKYLVKKELKEVGSLSTMAIETCVWIKDGKSGKLWDFYSVRDYFADAM